MKDPRLTRRQMAGIIRFGIAALLITTSIVLLSTVQDSVERVSKAVDSDPELGSSHYRVLIESIVFYHHVPVAVAYLTFGSFCGMLATFDFLGRRRHGVIGWGLWIVAVTSMCVFWIGDATGFSIRPGFEYELIKGFVDDNRPPIVYAASIVAWIALYAVLPWSNILQSMSDSISLDKPSE